MLVSILFIVSAVLDLAVARLAPRDAQARNLTVFSVPGDPGVSVSFKEPRGICRTAFASQKQYTGWVNIPGPRPTNLFFWFVESRQPTESLTVWLNGGPGASSMLGFFAENGPCQVVEKGLDDYDTVAREWGWDRASNMLFIDQVGFSYDTPTDGTLSFVDNSVSTPPRLTHNSLPGWASANGTFSTNDPESTASSSKAAALAVWHAIQGFLTAFPQYQPAANASVALSLFAQSYGGTYGPVFAETWEAQNLKRLTGILNPNTTLELRLTSLGIVNGCIDGELQIPALPAFANNNTYGIKALSDTEAALYRDKFSASLGCKDQLPRCRTAATVTEQISVDGAPQTNASDAICREAIMACLDIEQPYFNSGRSLYDLAAPSANPEPPLQFAEYLNQARVRDALGSPVDYTMVSDAVAAAFARTGDLAKGGNVARLAALLRRGVRVGLVYGDRDYVCNWFGGEAVSLAVAREAGDEYATKFAASGYAPIVVNDSYIGGEVRQFGNLSFSRVYQAGHSVAWYQPETAFQIFARVLLGRSVSMGTKVDLTAYNTSGPLNSTRTARAPEGPQPTCFVRAFNATCDADARELLHGGGVVINGVLYGKAEDWMLKPDLPTATASSTSRLASADAMTGLYTATATPSSDAARVGVVRGEMLWGWQLGVAVAAAVLAVVA